MKQIDPYHILGFKFNPFPPASSTKGYYFTPLIRQILEELFFGITMRKGIMVLVGEVGVGKTSLLLQLLNRLEKEKDLKVSWVFNTFLPPEEILKAIAIDFGLTPEGGEVSSLLKELHRFFVEVTERGGNCAIVVDEAHNLSEESLETLRMLSNLEVDGQKLVQIILAGQSELKFILNEAKFRQLRSRIQIFHVLQPLSREETVNYITYKLATSGAQVTISKKALDLVYQFSLGNLRMIHLLMDRAIHILVTKNESNISPKIVKMAAEDVSVMQEPIKLGLNRLYKKKVFQAVFCVCVLFLIGIGLFLYFNPSWSERTHFKNSLLKSEHKDIVVVKKTERGLEDVEVDSFLKQFNLLALKPVLIKAIEKKDYTLFRASLPSSIELIPTNLLPQKGLVKFAFFPWKEASGLPPKWLVLWKPPIKIDKSYPNRSSRVDILVLQTMLKELGFYTNRPDGKFGPSTLRAVTLFQKKFGLPQTQGVDGLSLLWMCVEYERFKRRVIGEKNDTKDTSR